VITHINWVKGEMGVYADASLGHYLADVWTDEDDEELPSWFWSVVGDGLDVEGEAVSCKDGKRQVMATIQNHQRSLETSTIDHDLPESINDALTVRWRKFTNLSSEDIPKIGRVYRGNAPTPYGIYTLYFSSLDAAWGAFPWRQLPDIVKAISSEWPTERWVDGYLGYGDAFTENEAEAEALAFVDSLPTPKVVDDLPESCSEDDKWCELKIGDDVKAHMLTTSFRGPITNIRGRTGDLHQWWVKIGGKSGRSAEVYIKYITHVRHDGIYRSVIWNFPPFPPKESHRRWVARYKFGNTQDLPESTNSALSVRWRKFTNLSSEDLPRIGRVYRGHTPTPYGIYTLYFGSLDAVWSVFRWRQVDEIVIFINGATYEEDCGDFIGNGGASTEDEAEAEALAFVDSLPTFTAADDLPESLLDEARKTKWFDSALNSRFEGTRGTFWVAAELGHPYIGMKWRWGVYLSLFGRRTGDELHYGYSATREQAKADVDAWLDQHITTMMRDADLPEALSPTDFSSMLEGATNDDEQLDVELNGSKVRATIKVNHKERDSRSSGGHRFKVIKVMKGDRDVTQQLNPKELHDIELSCRSELLSGKRGPLSY
jgi:hypothetical protein